MGKLSPNKCPSCKHFKDEHGWGSGKTRMCMACVSEEKYDNVCIRTFD